MFSLSVDCHPSIPLAAAGLVVFFASFSSSVQAHAQPVCGAEKTITVPLPDPVSGRDYEIYISLPDDYENDTSKTWPLLVLADGSRAFPDFSCRVRTMANEAVIGIDPVIVGLSYAIGEDRDNSRRRDYTPVQRKASDLAYGQAAAYQDYIRDVVLKHVENEYRVNPEKRVYWGHSYGGLLGSHILLTNTKMFQTYLLGSPSFWYEDNVIYQFEDSYAAENKDLDATVLMYVGGLEISRYDRTRKGKTRDMVAGMHDFEKRLESRNYAGLKMETTIIEDTDHRTSARPGFEWALKAAMPAP